MTTVHASARTGWLSYWRLPRADRRAVRRIERSGRAVGDDRLDGIALNRLRRAARRERHLGPLLRHRGDAVLPAADRLARLCSTRRHPSRTGLCAGAAAGRGRSPVTRPRTS